MELGKGRLNWAVGSYLLLITSRKSCMASGNRRFNGDVLNVYLRQEYS